VQKERIARFAARRVRTHHQFGQPGAVVGSPRTLLRYGRSFAADLVDAASEALPRSLPLPLLLELSKLLLRHCRDHQALTMGDVANLSALHVAK